MEEDLTYCLCEECGEGFAAPMPRPHCPECEAMVEEAIRAWEDARMDAYLSLMEDEPFI